MCDASIVWMTKNKYLYHFLYSTHTSFNVGLDLVVLVAMLCLWLIVVLGKSLSVDLVNTEVSF